MDHDTILLPNRMPTQAWSMAPDIRPSDYPNRSFIT